MAYRRSGSFKRPGYRRNFRFRRVGTHQVTRTRRWEIGQFFIDDFLTLPAGSGSQTLEFFHLASITASLTTHGAAMDPEERVGNVLANMQRRLEIGGLVFDWGWHMNAGIEGDESSTNMNHGDVHCSTYLLTDRLAIDPTTLDAFPVAVEAWDPFANMFPTAFLGTATPVIDSGQQLMPTRIHWHKSHMMKLQPFQVVGQVEGALYVPNGQQLERQFSTVNKRLRLSLSDEQGLYFACATRNAPSFTIDTNQRSLHRWFKGHLFYRFRQ